MKRDIFTDCRGIKWLKAISITYTKLFQTIPVRNIQICLPTFFTNKAVQLIIYLVYRLLLNTLFYKKYVCCRTRLPHNSQTKQCQKAAKNGERGRGGCRGLDHRHFASDRHA